MNIKKLIILSFFAFQLTANIYASSQSTYNEAFQAFNKALNIPAGATDSLDKAAAFIQNNAGSFAWSQTLKIAQSLNSSPQAMAVGLYLSEGNPITLINKFTNADVTKQGSSVLFNNLLNALSNAQASATPVQPVVQPATPAAPVVQPVTPAQPVAPVQPVQPVTPVTPTKNSETDNAALDLKAQIDSSLITYNSYLKSVNQTPLKIVVA